MERLVLKTFLNFLEDSDVFDYREKLSESLGDDLKAVFIDIKSKSDGIKRTVPEVQDCIRHIRGVIENLLSLINTIGSLYYHGKYENRPSKDALALNDYAPLNTFVLGIKNHVKSVAKICRKFVQACEEAKKGASNVEQKCTNEIRNKGILRIGAVGIAGGLMAGLQGLLQACGIFGCLFSYHGCKWYSWGGWYIEFKGN